MRPVGSEDYFEAKAFSVISDEDIGIFADLYMPLVGVVASAIYIAMVRESKNKTSGLKKHDAFFAKLQVTSGQFRKGVEALEAVGLLKTYYQKKDKVAVFLYGLYAPKDPSSYFQNPLLLGTLRRYLGEDEVQKIYASYHLETPLEGFEEVTSGFSEYFNPDFSDPVYNEGSLKAIPHKSGKIRTSFDYSAFANGLAEQGYHEKVISKKELSLIEKYASLYSFDGETMSKIVAKCIDYARPSGQKIDIAMLEKQCISAMKFSYTTQQKGPKSEVSSSSSLAAKIKLMDETAPIQFLQMLQGMKKPARADIKIVSSLSTEIGLPNPAINALIDYVLQKNNNVLSAAYCEKLGAYLVREGVKTARDAMDKLLATSKNSGGTKPRSVVEVDETNSETQQEKEKVESNLDKELDDFLNELYGDKK